MLLMHDSLLVETRNCLCMYQQACLSDDKLAYVLNLSFEDAK